MSCSLSWFRIFCCSSERDDVSNAMRTIFTNHQASNVKSLLLHGSVQENTRPIKFSVRLEFDCGKLQRALLHRVNETVDNTDAAHVKNLSSFAKKTLLLPEMESPGLEYSLSHGRLDEPVKYPIVNLSALPSRVHQHNITSRINQASPVNRAISRPFNALVSSQVNSLVH